MKGADHGKKKQNSPLGRCLGRGYEEFGVKKGRNILLLGRGQGGGESRHEGNAERCPMERGVSSSEGLAAEVVIKGSQGGTPGKMGKRGSLGQVPVKHWIWGGTNWRGERSTGSGSGLYGGRGGKHG